MPPQKSKKPSKPAKVEEPEDDDDESTDPEGSDDDGVFDRLGDLIEERVNKVFDSKLKEAKKAKKSKRVDDDDDDDDDRGQSKPASQGRSPLLKLLVGE